MRRRTGHPCLDPPVVPTPPTPPKALLRRAAYHVLCRSGTLALRRRWHRRAGRATAAVIVFHRVSATEPESGISVTPRRFEAILAMLSTHYDVMSASELVSRLTSRRPFTGREVVITFDDGYADNVEQAAPLLARYGLPACFFLTAGLVGTDRNFPWDDARGIASRMMTWPQARDLARQGFELGCHTMTHPDLGREPIASARVELDEARALVQRQAGATVAHFAYPFGGRENIRPDWLEAIRAAGFASSFCGFGGLVTAANDPFWIPRIGAAHQRSLTDLRIDIDDAW